MLHHQSLHAKRLFSLGSQVEAHLLLKQEVQISMLQTVNVLLLDVDVDGPARLGTLPVQQHISRVGVRLRDQLLVEVHEQLVSSGLVHAVSVDDRVEFFEQIRVKLSSFEVEQQSPCFDDVILVYVGVVQLLKIGEEQQMTLASVHLSQLFLSTILVRKLISESRVSRFTGLLLIHSLLLFLCLRMLLLV